MKRISSRIKRREELFGDKPMWMWLSVFHLSYKVWNVERIWSGTMWVWMLNPCIPHWKLYNKEGRKCLFLLFVMNYPSKFNCSMTHWLLIQWSGCWFAWWNRNCRVGWIWLVICFDYGDSTGSREWSHLIGWMVENWNDGGKVDGLSEWGDRIRCGLISFWLLLMIVQFAVFGWIRFCPLCLKRWYIYRKSEYQIGVACVDENINSSPMCFVIYSWLSSVMSLQKWVINVFAMNLII